MIAQIVQFLLEVLFDDVEDCDHSKVLHLCARDLLAGFVGVHVYASTHLALSVLCAFRVVSGDVGTRELPKAHCFFNFIIPAVAGPAWLHGVFTLLCWRCSGVM